MNPRLGSRQTLVATFILIAFGLLLINLNTRVSNAQGQIQVTAADPLSTTQGAINLNVKVNGKGFKKGAKAKWLVTGTTDPGGVTVNSTTFVNSSELTANITVSDTAAISNFDIQVTNSDGRGGKGTELFAVVAKSGGNAQCPALQPAPASDNKCYAVSPGCLDVTFGGTGLVTNHVGAAYADIASGVALQPDGKVVVLARVDNRDQNTGFDFAVIRYNSDGSLDHSFGDPDPSNASLRLGYLTTVFSSAGDFPTSILLQPDGRILVGGRLIDFQTIPYAKSMLVARYLTNGTLDPGFGSGGKVMVALDYLSQMALQSNNKIVLAGYSQSPSKFAVARLNTNGALDTTFGSGGKVLLAPANGNGSYGEVNTVTIQRVPAVTGEERIVIGGWSGTGGTINLTEWALQRLKPNGALDTTFGTSGRVVTSFFGYSNSVKKIAIDSSNRIVAGGTVAMANPDCGQYVNDFGAIRYSQDGVLDSSFAGGRLTVDVYGGNDEVSGLVIAPGGKILLVGTSRTSDLARTYVSLVRLNSDGTRDSSFGYLGNGVITLDTFSDYQSSGALALQPDGKLIVTGTIFATHPGSAGVARYWP